MVDIGALAVGLLAFTQLVVFGLALGLTVISFQAYQSQPSEQLQFAFLGFAFISMGVALGAIVAQLGEEPDQTTLALFRVVETVPFIIGFSMFYISLYR